MLYNDIEQAMLTLSRRCCHLGHHQSASGQSMIIARAYLTENWIPVYQLTLLNSQSISIWC